ncbi:DUF5681 domain-containing protein [Croceicoccus sp. BE223]|uniref:DUF5681 domain-containing protein n=1 Tax=Croceicoccus sp. BE223 TaxID=2817716 RepID=UPI00285B564F|nr:DUF5681 domain-containing protein [Croceicoccus sp. BE223]MDR7102891.1 hypothetical protein [Croceicoccus sp. BE223]
MSHADDEFDYEDQDEGNDGASGDRGSGAPEAETPYTVGYCKPPIHTRFPPGQSGNPRGRKKGSRGLKTDLHAELNRIVEVKIGKYQMKGTTQQLAIRTLALLAANGNLKASAQLLPLVLTVFGIEDRGADRRTLSAHDEAILDNFLKAFGGDASGELERAGSVDELIKPTGGDPDGPLATDRHIATIANYSEDDLP